MVPGTLILVAIQLIEWVNGDDDINNYNNKYGTGLPHAQGYYDDADRSTDEGMHRIKPGH